MINLCELYAAELKTTLPLDYSLKYDITVFNRDILDFVCKALQKPRVCTEKTLVTFTKRFLHILRYTLRNSEDEPLKCAEEVLNFVYENAQEIAKTITFADCCYVIGTNSEQPDHNYTITNRIAIVLAMGLMLHIPIVKGEFDK